MQQAFYNDHYGFAGAKVQHVLQADGMCYSFTCPLRRHDAMVLRESSMLTMLSLLYVNNDPLRPVKCVTDKAYGRTRHLRPVHTTLELRLMNAEDRAAAEAEDSRNKGPRCAVEMSFNNMFVNSPTRTTSLPIAYCRVVDLIGHTYASCGICKYCFLISSPVLRAWVIQSMECLVLPLPQ